MERLDSSFSVQQRPEQWVEGYFAETLGCIGQLASVVEVQVRNRYAFVVRPLTLPRGSDLNVSASIQICPVPKLPLRIPTLP